MTTTRRLLISRWLKAGYPMVLVVAGLMLLAAFPPPRRDDGDSGRRRLRVALFVNGTLGDKSFYDSAARGLKNAHASLGMFTRTIEGGTDPTRWEASLTDLVDGGDFDVVIAGSFTMVPLVQKLARRYPATRFIVFDAAVDYAQCGCANVHSILFRQNEGAYLAGFLAARLAVAHGTTATSHRLGVVGGMQMPVVEDFVVGFTAGAQAAVPGIAVTRQYVNSFTDPATGKEIAKALFAQGVSVVFHAAAASGQGVIEAAAEAGKYAIGVDSDQYALFRSSSPQRARAIVTSVLKNVDVALLQALARHRDGTLPYGRAESLGVADGGISLALESEVLTQAPRELLDALAQEQRRVVSGQVTVPSVFARSAR